MATNASSTNNLHASNINDTTIYPAQNNNIPVINDPKTDSINPINDIKKLEKHDDTNCDKHETEMEQLICNSLSTFHQFLKCQSNEDHKLTNQLFKDARGLAFLQITKGQEDLGVIGNGIIMSKLQVKNVWSGPCAISLKGNRTHSKNEFNSIDYILIFGDDKVFKMIAQNQKFKLGYDVSIGGILQRDNNNNNNNNNNQELHDDNSIKSVYIYSTSQPSDSGFILEGTEMYINEDYNKEFYTSLVDPTSVLNGNIEFPNNAEYYALCNILDRYSRNDYPNVDELFNKPKAYGIFNKLFHNKI